MLDLNKNFVDEVYDENGHVVDYTLKCPENFNFAYDVSMPSRLPSRTSVRFSGAILRAKREYSLMAT